MCKSSQLEREAKMLARAMMYNWKRTASSAPCSPQAEAVEQMPSFGDYVCRSLDSSNNPVPDDDPYSRQDSDCSLGPAVSTGTKADFLTSLDEEEPLSESQKFERASDILFKVAIAIEDTPQLPITATQLVVKSFIQQAVESSPAYSEFKKIMLEALKPFSGNLLRSVAVIMGLTTAVLSALSDTAAGAPLSPQVQAQLQEYTKELIMDVASMMGVSTDTSIVQQVRAKGEAGILKGDETEL